MSLKKYDFKIYYDYELKKFSKILRSKVDIISLLLETMIVMRDYQISNKLLDKEINRTSIGKIVLNIKKMSRLFYVFNEKIFSINFPFKIEESNNSFIFESSIIGEISDASIAQAKFLFQDEDFKTKNFEDFLEKYCDENLSENTWLLLKELMLYEDGYIRYDYDEKYADENFHPLNHYDVFYTSNSSFKIGLRESVDCDQFIDFLDSETRCRYLDKK